jgi:hypothetical protein
VEWWLICFISPGLKRRRHAPVRVVGQCPTRVVSGYFNYHAVPGNLIRLDDFEWRYVVYCGKPSNDEASSTNSSGHAQTPCQPLHTCRTYVCAGGWQIIGIPTAPR